jgi:hypothetical protein
MLDEYEIDQLAKEVGKEVSFAFRLVFLTQIIVIIILFVIISKM